MMNILRQMFNLKKGFAVFLFSFSYKTQTGCIMSQTISRGLFLLCIFCGILALFGLIV